MVRMPYIADFRLGLFSKAVWYFENHAWSKTIGGDASEVGSGPGSYNIHQSVWHVNCCNPELNGGGGWGIFNAIFGWENSATYGSVIAYNLYWLCIIVVFSCMRYSEKHGHYPLMKAKSKDAESVGGETDSQDGGMVEMSSDKEKNGGADPASTTVRELTV